MGVLCIGKLFNGRGGFASVGVSYEGGFIKKMYSGHWQVSCWIEIKLVQGLIG